MNLARNQTLYLPDGRRLAATGRRQASVLGIAGLQYFARSSTSSGRFGSKVQIVWFPAYETDRNPVEGRSGRTENTLSRPIHPGDVAALLEEVAKSIDRTAAFCFLLRSFSRRTRLHLSTIYASIQWSIE